MYIEGYFWMLAMLAMHWCVILRVDGETVVGVRQKRAPSICTTNACKSDAKSFLSYIDAKADPCKDFFQFACGKWIKGTLFPASQVRHGITSIRLEEIAEQKKKLLEQKIEYTDIEAVRKRKALYEVCMNLGGINSLGLSSLKYFYNIHQLWFPLLNDYRSSLESMIYLYTKYGFPSFLKFTIATDYIRPKDNIITINADLLLSSRSKSFYLAPDRLEKYRDFLTRLFDELDSGNHKSDVDAIINYEVEGAKLLYDPGTEPTYLQSYKRYRLSEVQDYIDKGLGDNDSDSDDYQSVDLKWVIGHLTGKYSDHYVAVKDLAQMKKLFHHILKSDKRTLFIKAALTFMNKVKYYLPSSILSIYEDYYEKLYNLKPKERWRLCQGHMHLAEARMYLDAHFSPQDKLATNKLIENIKAAAKRKLNKIGWMDKKTRSEAMKKINKMGQVSGYEDWLRDDYELNSYYERVRIFKQYALSSFISVFLAESISNINLLYDKNKRLTLDPSQVNAFYDFAQNRIILLAGILSDPFFNKDYISAVNYGAIGAVVGHELTHGFDKYGRDFDGDGKLHDWWSPAVDKMYEKNLQCAIDQYNGYELPNIGKVNGLSTVTENMADMVGLWIPHDAYEDVINKKKSLAQKLPDLPYTSDQYFFLAYARSWCELVRPGYQKFLLYVDNHAPEKFRVNGPLNGYPGFVKAFNCKKGSPMNNRTPCDLW